MEIRVYEGMGSGELGILTIKSQSYRWKEIGIAIMRSDGALILFYFIFKSFFFSNSYLFIYCAFSFSIYLINYEYWKKKNLFYEFN